MIPAIQHQFEFWSHIGQVGGFFRQYKGFSSLSPEDTTWPSKIFNLQGHHIDELKETIAHYQLPKSMALEDNEVVENRLQEQGFKQTSSVVAMTLEVSENTHYKFYSLADKVTDEGGAKVFSKIASDSFGYTIYKTTISPLLQSKRVQLFLGKYQGSFVSCGIVFQDSKGDSGLHMIGTKKEYRGLGLGKKMTEHLLSIAMKNGSTNIHLVASKLGAPIYYKLGFKHQGYLKSYTF